MFFFAITPNDSTMCAQNAQYCRNAQNCLRAAHRAVLSACLFFLIPKIKIYGNSF